MIIAVPYAGGLIFQHFGHTVAFKMYETEGDRVISSRVVDTNGSGHGALAGFLAENQVDVVLCGGIGGGAQMALANAGIRLYGGIAGEADEAVAALLAGTLEYNTAPRCNHHGEGHSCSGHGCGGSCGHH